MSKAQRTWNVCVHCNGESTYLGQVHEATEELARCSALHDFGIPEDEDDDPQRKGIRENDDFDVTPT